MVKKMMLLSCFFILSLQASYNKDQKKVATFCKKITTEFREFMQSSSSRAVVVDVQHPVVTSLLTHADSCYPHTHLYEYGSLITDAVVRYNQILKERE